MNNYSYMDISLDQLRESLSNNQGTDSGSPQPSMAAHKNAFEDQYRNIQDIQDAFQNSNTGNQNAAQKEARPFETVGNSFSNGSSGFSNFDAAMKDFTPTVQGTDLQTGFFGGTTTATQEDVDAGKATQVGQVMGETAGLAQSEQDSLSEILSDAEDRFNLKDLASSDKYTNASGYIPQFGNLRQASLTESLSDAGTAMGTIVDASTGKQSALEGASADITPFQQNVSTEAFQDAQSARTLLDDSAGQQFSNLELASTDLADVQRQANQAQYRNIQDALRSDRLDAMRMSKGGTRNSADRMMLEAEMRAADRYSNLDNAATLAEAERTYGNAQQRENQLMQNAGIESRALMEDNQNQAVLDEARRTLQNTQAGESERLQAAQILSNEQLTNNTADAKLATLSDEFGVEQERQNERMAFADELANTVGSTQEQTLPAITLAEQLIEQSIDEGNMEIDTAEQKRQAIISSARELLNSPSLMAAMSEQLASEGINLAGEYTTEQQRIQNQINNIKSIPGLVDEIIAAVGNDTFAAYRAAYGEQGAIWAAGLQLQLVDSSMAVPPPNSYAPTLQPENNINFTDGQAASADDSNIVEKGLNSFLSRIEDEAFKHLFGSKKK